MWIELIKQAEDDSYDGMIECHVRHGLSRLNMLAPETRYYKNIRTRLALSKDSTHISRAAGPKKRGVKTHATGHATPRCSNLETRKMSMSSPSLVSCPATAVQTTSGTCGASSWNVDFVLAKALFIFEAYNTILANTCSSRTERQPFALPKNEEYETVTVRVSSSRLSLSFVSASGPFGRPEFSFILFSIFFFWICVPARVPFGSSLLFREDLRKTKMPKRITPSVFPRPIRK
jgi:hypothetical protein